MKRGRKKALVLVGCALLCLALSVETAYLWLPATVDLARGLPGVGFGRMHRLEQSVLGAWDAAARLCVDASSVATIKPPAQALDSLWPPAPLQPIIAAPSLVGEGLWEPFAPQCRAADVPADVMVRAQLRVDGQRPDVTVTLLAMDMRRLRLRLRPGTDVGGSGALPSGAGPLVAAFNGGFQTTHGDFGLVTSGRVWVPPSAGSATLAVRPDGRLWMGLWRQGLELGGLELRQNLQPLLQGTHIQPQLWLMDEGRREILGHSPTRRSGLCVRAPFTLIYVWTHRGSAEALGRAMLAAGCSVGMHLDLNAFHTRFEALAQPEAAAVCAERLHPRMTDGPFPRYLTAQSRDFFVLSLRPAPLREPVFRGEGFFDR